MTIHDKTKMGNRGEIIAKKSLREISGIKPGDNVLIEAVPGEIIIRKIYTVNELLEMPIIAEGTAESMEKDINNEQKKQEEMSLSE